AGGRRRSSRGPSATAPATRRRRAAAAKGAGAAFPAWPRARGCRCCRRWPRSRPGRRAAAPPGRRQRRAAGRARAGARRPGGAAAGPGRGPRLGWPAARGWGSRRRESGGRTRSLPRGVRAGKFPACAGTCGRLGSLTPGVPILNIPRLMSTDVPEILDAWRMVAARRGFTGRLPLSSMPRLRDALLEGGGEAAFSLQFDRDSLQVPYVELRIDAALPLECQRTLQRFELPVRIVQRLGLIAAGGDEEVDEAALPEGYEALHVPE